MKKFNDLIAAARVAYDDGRTAEALALLLQALEALAAAKPK